MRDRLPETISLPIWAWLSLGSLFCILLYLLVTCNPFPPPVQNPTVTSTPTWTAIPPTHIPTRTLTPTPQTPTEVATSTSQPTFTPTTEPTNTATVSPTPTLQEPTVTPMPTITDGRPTKLPTTGTDNASQQWLGLAAFGLYVVLAGVLLRSMSPHLPH